MTFENSQIYIYPHRFTNLYKTSYFEICDATRSAMHGNKNRSFSIPDLRLGRRPLRFKIDLFYTVVDSGPLVKLLLHTGLRLKIGVLIDGIVDQQLIRGFEKPFDVQDFVRVSFLPMRLFELNFRNIKLLFACFFNLSFKMC